MPYKTGAILLLLILLLPARLLAQQVCGNVVYENGDIAYGVPVTVLDSQQVIVAQCLTDTTGKFCLSVPYDKPCRLVCTLPGYNTYSTEIRLTNDSLKLRIKLSISSLTLPVVVVSGEVEEKDVSENFTKIDLEPLLHVTGPAGGVETVLKTLPDVSSNNEMSSQYSVRGGSYDENLVYINGVEIYRPMLVRCGQQEGLSIVNPDLVQNLYFSPGGFDVSYGDKMSSVLDLDYRYVGKSFTRLSLSFLGGSASVKGKVGKLSYLMGLRQHSNHYIMGSLDTKGQYATSYTDFQSLLSYHFNPKWSLSFLGMLSRNIYGLVPQSRVTTFGSFQEELQLEVFFDGQEKDRYFTQLAALDLSFRPRQDWHLDWITSWQGIRENEIYDIQSQYWLYELGMGESVGEFERFDRGYGTFLEHARNYLSTRILASELKATHQGSVIDWKMGLKGQYEWIDDQVLEWKWVDSANFSLPNIPYEPGNAANRPFNPIMQNYCHAHNLLQTFRLSGYVNGKWDYETQNHDKWVVNAGVRSQMYGVDSLPVRAFLSPRVSCIFTPHKYENVRYRFSTGIYHQPPFYREYRADDGSLNLNLRSPRSYQVVGSMDWYFLIWDKPVTLITDLYYKYIDNLIPYRIDNLRLRYDATNNAEAYCTGISLRLGGELVEGLESWGSFSLMKTQERLLDFGDEWIDRPTDQRCSFKLFLQDNIPTIPFWRMSLNFVVGTGIPTLRPNSSDRGNQLRLPPYYRVDWGNTLQLSRFEKLRNKPFFQKVDDLEISLEVFNLFNYHNVVSFLWVADYTNTYMPVPEYLTARQLNLRLTLLF